MYTPIVIFAYNRLTHIKNLISNLKRCSNVENHDCYIFSDASSWNKKNDEEKVKEVRLYLHSMEVQDIFRTITIVEAQKHKGLRKSVIEGITKVIHKYGRIIDIEDDLIVSEDFLDYMDEGLDYFEENKKIWSVTGCAAPLRTLDQYSGSTFLTLRAESLGFGTWADRWDLVDWNVSDGEEFRTSRLMQDEFSKVGYDLPEMLIGKLEGCLDSWAVVWAYECYKNGTYIVCPKYSKVLHNGVDGTHFNGDNLPQQTISRETNNCFFSDADYLDPAITAEYRELYRSKEEYENKRKYLYLDKFYRQYMVLHKWMLLQEAGISIKTWFRENGFKRVAIYGGGQMAIHLIHELQDGEILVAYIIDQKKRGFVEGIEIVSTVGEACEVDVIIVTPIMEYRAIEKKLREQGALCKIVSLEEIIIR